MKLMTETLENILKANKKYSEKIKNQKKLPHNAKFAIVTCMDERIDPVQFAGLRNNAHVIRNAGGRVTDDVIRSLIISHKLLGTQEWFVIQHTDCGGMTFTNNEITELLSESLESAEYGENGWYNPSKEGGSAEGQYINFYPIDNIEKTDPQTKDVVETPRSLASAKPLPHASANNARYYSRRQPLAHRAGDNR